MVCTREHQSVLSFFKSFNSAIILSSTIGSRLKSVAFLCMKQLSLARRSRTVESRTSEATPEKEPIAYKLHHMPQHPHYLHRRSEE